MGHSACSEALQRIPFISTIGGSILPAADMLDPTVDKLRAMHLAPQKIVVAPFIDYTVRTTAATSTDQHQQQCHCYYGYNL